MPGDEHISCAHELSLWALHAVTIALHLHSIDYKYVSNERQECLAEAHLRCLQMAQMVTPRPSFPCGPYYIQ